MNRFLSFVVLSLIGAVAALAQLPSLPPPPENVKAAIPLSGQNRVVLSWDVEDGPWSFKIYRSQGDTLNFQWIAHTSVRQYQDLNVEPSTLYYYYLTSVDSAGAESHPSEVTFATTRDTVLGSKGIITGVVLDDSTSLPVRGTRVRLFTVGLESAGVLSGSTITDSAGRYSAVVDTGTYLVRFEPLESEDESSFTYDAQWFDGATDPSGADPMAVGAGDTLTASARLHRIRRREYFSLRGNVADRAGNALRGAEIAVVRDVSGLASALPDSGDESPYTEIRDLPGLGYLRGVLWSGTSDSLGRYHGSVPQGGPYMVMAWAQGFYIQVFNSRTDPTNADLLTVNSDTAGIDFHLYSVDSNGHTIQGKLTDPTGIGVAGRAILFPRPTPTGANTFTYYVNTTSGGLFTFPGVPAGPYILLAIPYSDFAPSYYAAGAFNVQQWNLADSIVVNGPVASIVVGVSALGSVGPATISGRVNTTEGKPVVGGRVIFSSSLTGQPIAYSLTDTSGQYATRGIPAGSLSVTVDNLPLTSVSGNFVLPVNQYVLTNVNFTLDPATTSVSGSSSISPTRFELEQNYPNPFNPTTVISGQWPVASVVRLVVYDLLGREVAVLANGPYPAGKYTFKFDGSRLASGVYFYRLTAGSYTNTRSMLLVR